jgi:hypothetical protein
LRPDKKLHAPVHVPPSGLLTSSLHVLVRGLVIVILLIGCYQFYQLFLVVTIKIQPGELRLFIT